MYSVNDQGVVERIICVRYYYYYYHWTMRLCHIYIHQWLSAACSLTYRQNELSINTYTEFTDVCSSTKPKAMKN